MHTTRESWLHAFATEARIQFTSAGLEYPDDLRIGCGDLGKRHAGVAYHAEVSTIGASEVTIGLRRDDPVQVAGTLVHELIHACGIKKHGADFKRAGTALGLVGKPSAMGWHTREEVPDWGRAVLAQLDPYPKGRLDPTAKPKQTTRMIKCACHDCGLVFRITRKYLEGYELGCPNKACDGELETG